MAQILVVDDDPHIRELVRVIMQREGYAVAEAADGMEALERMKASAADLVILDIMMPRMDGWALCKELQRLYEVPLLMLTAKGETGDKVRGFELGTDDYLVKPFDPPELAVRVKALLKRYRINSSQQVSAAGLTLDRAANRAQAHGEELALPPKEFELLFMLLGNQGRTLTRDQLIESIWGYDFDGNERTLDVHINRLRERLAQRDVPLAIRTVRGLGYRMENAT
ncbi:response regulator transcription factor [Paenibacillus methanolicus]|uniref:Heme response regulator HssR n=1 Tax=Paenibacillus methanolicus TaxID=582686 RepID=A0A5S5C6Q7_9BACL|nr:response regulator transcription factor [Paenibacillus methanolicus]TYP74020.1 DNA-binding response OmpR family regulator [Paenibacillus methanolicus]